MVKYAVCFMSAPEPEVHRAGIEAREIMARGRKKKKRQTGTARILTTLRL